MGVLTGDNRTANFVSTKCVYSGTAKHCVSGQKLVSHRQAQGRGEEALIGDRGQRGCCRESTGASGPEAWRLLIDWAVAGQGETLPPAGGDWLLAGGQVVPSCGDIQWGWLGVPPWGLPTQHSFKLTQCFGHAVQLV